MKNRLVKVTALSHVMLRAAPKAESSGYQMQLEELQLYSKSSIQSLQRFSICDLQPSPSAILCSNPELQRLHHLHNTTTDV